MGILYTFFMALSGFFVARALHTNELDNLTVVSAFMFGFFMAKVLAGSSRNLEDKP